MVNGVWMGGWGAYTTSGLYEKGNPCCLAFFQNSVGCSRTPPMKAATPPRVVLSPAHGDGVDGLTD